MGLYSTQSEPIRNETLSVTATSSIICEQRNSLNKRKVLVLRNISNAAADVITINLGATTAVANAGIVLRQGDSFTDATDAGYEAYQDQISAVCATANGQLAIMER